MREKGGGVITSSDTAGRCHQKNILLHFKFCPLLPMCKNTTYLSLHLKWDAKKMEEKKVLTRMLHLVAQF